MYREDFTEEYEIIEKGREFEGFIGPLAEEDTVLMREYKDAVNRVAEANIGLVYKVASSYTYLPGVITFDDIVQDGFIGLMRAVEKFDKNLGYKFSTYALRWIRQGITRSLYTAGRTIRLPENRATQFSTIKELEEKDIPEEEVDDILYNKYGMTRSVKDSIKLANITSSLDASVPGMDGASLGDTIESTEDIEEEVVKGQSFALLFDVMNELPVVERELLEAMYLENGTTVAEVSEKHGFTSTRGYSLIKGSLEKVKEGLENKGMEYNSFF